VQAFAFQLFTSFLSSTRLPAVRIEGRLRQHAASSSGIIDRDSRLKVSSRNHRAIASIAQRLWTWRGPNRAPILAAWNFPPRISLTSLLDRGTLRSSDPDTSAHFCVSAKPLVECWRCSEGTAVAQLPQLSPPVGSIPASRLERVGTGGLSRVMGQQARINVGKRRGPR
jgi:hypothetical protein